MLPRERAGSRAIATLLDDVSVLTKVAAKGSDPAHVDGGVYLRFGGVENLAQRRFHKAVDGARHLALTEGQAAVAS